MKLFLCKIHVIIRTILNHEQGERFWPILTISSWVQLIGQSTLYILWSRLKPYVDYEFGEFLLEILIVGSFLLTFAVIHWMVYDKDCYGKAEQWLSSKQPNERWALLVSSAIFFVVSFLVMLIWMIYEM